MPNHIYPLEPIGNVIANRRRWFKITIKPLALTMITAIFIATTGNTTFWIKVATIYPLAIVSNWFIHAALLLLLISLISLSIAFTAMIVPVRVAVSLFLIVSSLIAYFTDHLGLVIDSEMIRNIVQTDRAEAGDLWNTTLALKFVLFGILPVMIIWMSTYTQPRSVIRWRNFLLLAIANISVILILVLSFSGHFSTLFREHRILRYYTNPVYPIYAVAKYIEHRYRAPESIVFNQLSRIAYIPPSDVKRELVIVVVGEAARADHFSINGYQRETNPRLSRLDSLISYSDVVACGTSTAVSVPCLFSFSDRKSFDVEKSPNTENVLDVLAKAGVSVLWRDNNSSSKGVAERVTFQNYKTPDFNSDCDYVECRDRGMLLGLQNYIDQQQRDILIVLHQMGSHGPAYYKRYPKQFEKFMPACNSSELGNCTQQEIINSYDNSILYTDYFLSQVIKLLQDNTPNFETTLFYVGDHGESLGESGLYLHGMPYELAPEEQVHVPFIIWVGESSDIDYHQTLLLRDRSFSHDAFSYGLLNIFEVVSDIVEPLGTDHFFAKY